MVEIILIRLLSSTLILRFPLFGALLAIFIDYQDLNLLYNLDPNSIDKYQSLDKLLDYFYLSLEAYIVFGWKNKFAKNIALVIYFYRLIGVIVFELTQSKAILFIFPNVFEYFYIFYQFYLAFLEKRIILSKKNLLILVIFLTFPKLFHEYLLHINTTHPWWNNKYVKQFTNFKFEGESLTN